MIPRFRPPLGLREIVAALRPGSEADIARFEAAFADWAGQRHAIAFPYGRTAQMQLLEALGLQGREVIMPAYTCVVVAHAVVKSGNEPVFVDCAPGSANMDIDAAEAAIGPNTGALIATSIYGEPVDLDRLAALAARHPNVVILQDCAHSFAAEWEGRPVQRMGRAAFYGLNASKLLSSVFGGMVTTDDDELATRLRRLRVARLQPAGRSKSLRRLLYLLAVIPAFFGAMFGFVDRLRRAGLLDRFTRYYDEGAIDMPADHLQAMTPLEARVGLANLRRWPAIVAARRTAAAHFAAALADQPDLRLPQPTPGHTWSHYAVEVADRDARVARARRHGVELGILIEYNIPDMPAYRDRPGYRDCPEARRRAAGTINLPVWSADSRRLARIVAAVCADSTRPNGRIHLAAGTL